MSIRVQKALQRAAELRGRSGPILASAPPRVAVRRTVAIGDPQTTADRFFAVLDQHGLLGDDGGLRADVQLISMGDHFDFDFAQQELGRAAGVLILGWLASHAPEQVVILFGNHDAARVMELATTTDARFRAAEPLARELKALESARDPRYRECLVQEFLPQFPELATPGYVVRDYNSFTEEQRSLVRALLVAGRFRLAAAARAVTGEPLLFSHAGVTIRQLAELGIAGERDPSAVAGALHALLTHAVAAVAPDWLAGAGTPLSLDPVHVAGADGEEGGGLLYHRPSNPDRPGADPRWEAAARRPRRFHPRDLPAGLVQVAGHTGHHKCVTEMPGWHTDEPGDRSPDLRTLRARPDGVVEYRRGLHLDAALGDGVLLLVDPEMHRAPSPADVEVLDLAAGSIEIA